MRARSIIVHILGLALLLAATQAAAQSRAWNFEVLLNDTPIGYHRFTLREQGAMREMKIEARFNMKVLFVNVYHYIHDASERWNGSCLDNLSARTDDNGEQLAVDAVNNAGQLNVKSAKAGEALDGCVMSFAYWNPAILRQPRLLNAQTGEYEAVKITELGDDSVMVRGVAVPAKRYRITGPKNPIDLWYSADRDWLALESTVAGGRRLRYRIN